jgi:transcriptional regulator with XRE-family HTH domain
MKQRGRPKGRSNDNRSYGPLGDLIRNARITRGLGLADVAKACDCSVQFISNIEHGRAPLPWEKVSLLAAILKVSVEEVRAANLSIRSDFKSFVGVTGNTKRSRSGMPAGRINGTASAVAFAAKDNDLRELINRYQTATPEIRKRFVRTALQIL